MKKLILLFSILLSSLSFAGIAPGPGEVIKEAFAGPGIELYVFEDMSAIMQFDCASAYVQPGRWPTGQSRIAATGIYSPVHGPRDEKATFKANIDVATGRMTLAMKIGDRRAVPYRLVRNQPSDMKHCR